MSKQDRIPLFPEQEIRGGCEAKDFLKFAGEMRLLLEPAFDGGLLHTSKFDEQMERTIQPLFLQPFGSRAIITEANEAFDCALAHVEAFGESSEMKARLKGNPEEIRSMAR